MRFGWTYEKKLGTKVSPAKSKPRRDKHRETIWRAVNFDGLADMLQQQIGGLFDGTGADGAALIGADDAKQEQFTWFHEITSNGRITQGPCRNGTNLGGEQP